MQPSLSPCAVVVDGNVVVGTLGFALLEGEREPVESHDCARVPGDDPGAIRTVRIALRIGGTLKRNDCRIILDVLIT